LRYLTDAANGYTSRVAVPVPKGYLALAGPVLASSGRLAAALVVTPEAKRMHEPTSVVCQRHGTT
jgi:hypothetical protein